MGRYDVYVAPDGCGYVVDVQSDVLEDLNTRVVIPLMSLATAPKPAERLNPVFEINGDDHVLVTQFLSSVPVKLLGSAVENIDQHHLEIVSAVDMLLQGY